MERKEIILPEKRYEKAPTEELSTVINFDESQVLLTNDERNVVLDVNELFNQERNDSLNYKLFGKVKMIFRNMYSGNSEYTYLKNKLVLSSGDFSGYLPYNEFAFLRNDFCREVNEKVVTSDLFDFTGFTTSITGTTGSTQHNLITEINSPYFNWNFYLTYVYDQNKQYKMTYTLSGDTSLSFFSSDGIPFRVTDGGKSYVLTSPVNHGMSEGEHIIINNESYYINSIGNEIYDSEKYVINILKSQVVSGSTTFTPVIITGKRCVNGDNVTGTTSEYYVHIHKTLTSIDQYGIDKTGFESLIWKDERKLSSDNSTVLERNRMESNLFDFKDPFILSGITNNLGYTPTEVYCSIIFRNGNGYFNYPPKVGYKFNFHDGWIDKHFDGDDSIETSITGTEFEREGFFFVSGDTLPVGTTLIGAFVEYNPIELRERIISESFHKITSNPDVFNHCQMTDNGAFTGSTIDNMFGLFYQPHYRIKLRELSPYVETYNNTIDVDSLPQNAKYFTSEEVWRWRDLYDQGYIDDLGYGVDYPFINNTHHVKREINFYIRNEVLYTNKVNGIYSFNQYRKNNKDNINC